MENTTLDRAKALTETNATSDLALSIKNDLDIEIEKCEDALLRLRKLQRDCDDMLQKA